MAESLTELRDAEEEAQLAAWDAVWIIAEVYYREEIETGNSPGAVWGWDDAHVKWAAYREAIERRVRAEDKLLAMIDAVDEAAQAVIDAPTSLHWSLATSRASASGPRPPTPSSSE